MSLSNSFKIKTIAALIQLGWRPWSSAEEQIGTPRQRPGSQFSPCIPFTPQSPLHRFAIRPPSCTFGIKICHPTLGLRNERLAMLDLNVQRRNGSTLKFLLFSENNALLGPPQMRSLPDFPYFPGPSAPRRRVCDAAKLVDGLVQRSSVHVKVTSAECEQRHERPRTPSFRTRLKNHRGFVAGCWETVDPLCLNEVFETRCLLQHGRL